MTAIKVAVIDDHELFREGVISMLSRDSGIDVVGEGGSAEDAIRIASTAGPDVMLLDVAMPGGGIEAARTLSRSCPNLKLIMLTVSETADDVIAAFENGVVGYVLKGIRRAELIDAVQSAHQGDFVVAPSLAGRILGKLNSVRTAKPHGTDDALNLLTPRENMVLTLVAQGLSNKQVARQLGLTERTIKNNMTSIMQKLQVSNRVEATLRLRG
jgi:two-component system nitrate/nitrite response regulator NarL